MSRNISRETSVISDREMCTRNRVLDRNIMEYLMLCLWKNRKYIKYRINKYYMYNTSTMQ